MSQKKDINNNLNRDTNTYSLPIFKDNSFNYLYSKTEKIVTAIYMITNFMSVSEPLKWQLRDNSLKLLDSVMSLSKSSLSNRESIIREISNYLFEVKSMFGIGYRSGFISNMNFELIDKQLTHLAEILSEYDSTKLSVESNLFGEGYFGTDLPKGHISAKSDFIGQDNKGHNLNQNFRSDINSNNKQLLRTKHVTGDLNSFNELNNSENKSNTKSVSNNNNNEERRTKIVAILKDKGPASLKDISIHITGVSEKTIQRELNYLTSKGQVIKEGERRWSKYYIK